MKYFIFAIAGSGKTYLTKHYFSVIDLCFTKYKRILEPQDLANVEHFKCSPSTKLNPEFPENLRASAMRALDRSDVVLSALNYEAFSALADIILARKDTKILIVTAAFDCINNYMNRWILRGSHQAFCEMYLKAFYSLNKFFQGIKEFDQIILKPNQFLADALIEYGIKLRPIPSLKDINMSREISAINISRESGANKELGTNREVYINKEFGTNREVDTSKEVGTNRELGISREVGANNEIGTNKEIGKNKEVCASKEICANKEVDESKQINISRQFDLGRQISAIREFSISREINASKEININKEVSINRETTCEEVDSSAE